MVAASSYNSGLVAGGGDAALAGEYLLLGASLSSAVQVMFMAGAIRVLFVVVICWLNCREEERTSGNHVALLIASRECDGSLLIAWVLLITLVPKPWYRRTAWTPQGNCTVLFHNFLLPFEVTFGAGADSDSGAVVLAAKPEPETKERDGTAVLYLVLSGCCLPAVSRVLN